MTYSFNDCTVTTWGRGPGGYQQWRARRWDDPERFVEFLTSEDAGMIDPEWLAWAARRHLDARERR